MRAVAKNKKRWKLFGPAGRIFFLLSTLVAEIVVWYSMQWNGWNESLRLGGVGTLLLISSVPLLIAMLMLVWSWRLSIRRMLIAVAFVAIFLAAVAIPYQRYWMERKASFALSKLNMPLVPHDERIAMNSMFPMEAPDKGTFSESALKTIAWLQPSLRRIYRDIEICEVAINNDQQLNVFLAHANKLPNVRQINLGGQVSNSGRELVADSISNFPNILSVTICCSKDFQVESIRNLRGIKILGFQSESWQSPPLPLRLGKVVCGLDSLMTVHVSGFAISSATLQEWEETDSEFLSFWSPQQNALTKSDLCRFSIVSPNVKLLVHPIPSREY